MSEWNSVQFKDYFAVGLRNGLTKPSRVRGSGSRMVNMKEIFGYDVITDKTPMELVPVTDKELENSSLEYDDLLFARQSLVESGAGKIAIFKGNLPTVFESHLIRCRIDKDRACPDFIYYLFKSPIGKGTVSTIVQQVAAAGIKGSDLQNLIFSFPPLPEQKAIASVLSSLDDKIDLLHRQNQTLEAMAETLFRQWFVEEAGGWEDGIVADLIEFNPSRKLAKGTVAPYLEMAALSNATFNPDGWYDREFSSGTKFINGDTLLARITPCLENGKTAYVTFLEDNQIGWGSTEYIVMRPQGSIHSFFAYALARNGEFRDYAEGCLAGSSGRQRVDIDHLKNYEIKIPSAAVISEFNAFAESITPKLQSNSLQIQTLEKLRDTLLPKLMSGEVRVRA